MARSETRPSTAPSTSVRVGLCDCSNGWKHLILVALLICYTILGAYTFIYFEKEQDEQKKERDYQEAMRKYTEYNETKLKLEEIYEELQERKAFVPKEKQGSEDTAIQWCIDETNKVTIPKRAESMWTIYGGVFYSSSIYTTVGYGKIHCVTTWGRIFTMAYALLGIPLIILILNDFGNLLFRFTCWSWNNMTRLRQKCFKKRNIGVRCCMPTEIKSLTHEHDYLNMETVPLSLALLICIGYICMCAAIYCTFEEWTFFTSFYYFFISLTTIGLGDVVPNNMKYATSCGVLIIFGLAVVSMSLNVIQAKLDAIFKQAMKYIDEQFKQSLQTKAIGMQNIQEGLAQMHRKQPMLQKVLFKMMSEQKKKQIYDKWESKAKLRNAEVQTEPFVEDVGIQTYTRGKSAVTTQTMARNCFPCKGGSIDRIYLNFNHVHDPDAEHNHIHDHREGHHHHH